MLSTILSACGFRKKTPQETAHESMLKEIRELITKDRKTPGIPATGRSIPEGNGYGHWTLIAGVWVEDRLYYEALKVPMGDRPAGDDVQDLSPGIPAQTFSGCGRCKRSWKWVEGHSTMYNGSQGTFPLCEKCWSELTPETRLPYYKALFDSNTEQIRHYEGGRLLVGRNEEWAEIEKAVLEGK